MIPPPQLLYEGIVRRALREDLGRAGDITTDAIVPEITSASARIITRQAGCLAGIDVALLAFSLLDPGVRIKIMARDGEEVHAGQVLARVRGSARAILQGERTALNFLGHLSGIATVTHSIVKRVNSSARVLCTRKTTPGLGALEKYAVRAGGGSNHRFGLDDAVLIKENHLAVAGSIKKAVSLAREKAGHMVKIEVEVETLEQLHEAVSQKVDSVMLDNMSVEMVREAVQWVDGRIPVEVSGGITPESAQQFAETGADLLSVGWLTHSAPNLDVALELEFEAS